MATKDDKFSLNISLDVVEDKEIIEYFKQGGKRVDLLRSAMKIYFESNRGLSDNQEEEVKRLIKNALDSVMVNITTSNVVINSNDLQNKDSIVAQLAPNEAQTDLNKVINDCGVNIDFG